MRSFLREPLLHFLLLGVGLFWIFNLLNPNAGDDPKRIDVSRADLLSFMQYRARVVDAERFEALLEQMSQVQLQQLIDDYVREEAMFREARALGLDAYDYLARRRLVQRLEYALSGLGVDMDLSEGDLQDYYEVNKSAYLKAPEITFTHVFISQKNKPHESALQEAQKILQRLRDQQIPFDRAPGYGDRFLYHTNYVDRVPDQVSGHFGPGFQQQVFALGEDSLNTWQGPLSSEYGLHLVLVTSLKQGYQPELNEIYNRVLAGARQEKLSKALDKAIATIVAGYRVNVQKEKFESKSSAETLPIPLVLRDAL